MGGQTSNSACTPAASVPPQHEPPRLLIMSRLPLQGGRAVVSARANLVNTPNELPHIAKGLREPPVHEIDADPLNLHRLFLHQLTQPFDDINRSDILVDAISANRGN